MCSFFVSQCCDPRSSDLQQLAIDSIFVSFSGFGFSESSTIDYIPPDIWVMGAYQGVIVDITAGTVSLLVESTPDFGGSPTSDTVDPVAGTIDLSLTDLHATVTGPLSGDFDVWNDSTSTIDANTYDSVTNAFVYGWSDVTFLEALGFNVGVDYSVQLSGTASAVPVPAPVWLFGSAFASLAWIRRRA